MKIRTKDVTERVFWTFVVGALSNLLGVTLLDIELWKAAVLAGLSAVLTYMLALGRWRLSVLPDPGAAVAVAAREETIDQLKQLSASSGDDSN